MTAIRMFTLSALLFGGAGCAPIFDGTAYPIGLIYSDVRAPHPTTILEADGPEKTGSKQGEACAEGILGLAAWGDASIDAAKKQAGITDVHTIEHARSNVLFVYYTGCTIVTGE